MKRKMIAMLMMATCLTVTVSPIATYASNFNTQQTAAAENPTVVDTGTGTTLTAGEHGNNENNTSNGNLDKSSKPSQVSYKDKNGNTQFLNYDDIKNLTEEELIPEELRDKASTKITRGEVDGTFFQRANMFNGDPDSIIKNSLGNKAVDPLNNQQANTLGIGKTGVTGTVGKNNKWDGSYYKNGNGPEGDEDELDDKELERLKTTDNGYVRTGGSTGVDGTKGIVPEGNYEKTVTEKDPITGLDKTTTEEYKVEWDSWLQFLDKWTKGKSGKISKEQGPISGVTLDPKVLNDYYKYLAEIYKVKDLNDAKVQIVSVLDINKFFTETMCNRIIEWQPERVWYIYGPDGKLHDTKITNGRNLSYTFDESGDWEIQTYQRCLTQTSQVGVGFLTRETVEAHTNVVIDYNKERKEIAKDIGEPSLTLLLTDRFYVKANEGNVFNIGNSAANYVVE